MPEYICVIARAISRGGKSVQNSIQIAVSRVKRWAAGLDNVDADTRAKAAKAVAQWEAMKAKTKAKKVGKKATKGNGRSRDGDTDRADLTADMPHLTLILQLSPGAAQRFAEQISEG